MASTAPSTPGTKRCPGFAGGDPAILPHEAPADLEHFNSNKGSKDGLSSRCRVCGNAYGKAWAAKKRAAAASPANFDATVTPDEAWAAEHAATSGEHFGLTSPGSSASTLCPLCVAAISEAATVVDAVAQVAAVAALEPMATRTYSVAEGGGLVPVRYHDELAERASAGELEGYSAEVIDGVTYALPVNGTVATDEGQAALEATNAAHAAARRKRDADRKRTERAAAKRAKDEAAAGKA